MAVLLATSVIGCGQRNRGYIHYINTEFHYILDYPEVWHFEELNPNEIEIKPKDSEYARIRVGAFLDSPMLKSLSQEMAIAKTETSLEQFINLLGYTCFSIITNGPASGIWDWEASFTTISGAESLSGSKFTKETEFVRYIVYIIYAKGTEFTDGWDVIDSFVVY